MSERFDIIIVGGGIVGASVAYHLGQLGRYSVCLLERDQLTSGTTWHAAGLVAELRASANLTRLARYSGELYEQLESEGYGTGFKRVGAITLALNSERSLELKRQAAMARSCGIDCRWLSAAELSERWPHLQTSDVQGGVYMPRDGQTNPVDTTLALAAAARKAGVVVREKTPVRRLTVAQGRIAGVATDDGVIAADKVLLAAGLWTRQLALEAGANVPLYPCEHYYAVTEAVDLPGDTPIVRVPDEGVYLKPDAGRLLIGSFEREAKPLDPASLPAEFSFAELPFDLEHFAPLPGQRPRAPGGDCRNRYPHLVQRPGKLHARMVDICSGNRRNLRAFSSPLVSTPSAFNRPAVLAGSWPAGSTRAGRVWISGMWMSDASSPFQNETGLSQQQGGGEPGPALCHALALSAA